MIYLIRHGETEANIKHIYCGRTDLELSEAGIEKLRERRKVAEIAALRAQVPESLIGDADFTGRGSESPIGDSANCKVVFITSGMKRTEQTLELLFGDVEHAVDPRFREIDFGIFEMRSYYDLKDTLEYQEWISGDNEANVCPDGESGRQMETRAMEAFDELRDSFRGDSGHDVVVVTHGGVIAAIMNNLFPEEDKTRFDWQPAPGCGYVIVSENEYKEL